MREGLTVKPFAVTIIALLLFCVPINAQKEVKPKGKITKDYDRFKNRTTVILRMSLFQPFSGYCPDLLSFYSYDGTTFSKPDKIFLGFENESKEWHFLQEGERSFMAITERGRLDYGILNRVTNKVVTGGVIEIIGTEISPDDYGILAFAQRAEIQIGRTELKLKPEHLASLRQFATEAGVSRGSLNGTGETERKASPESPKAETPTPKTCYQNGHRVPCP